TSRPITFVPTTPEPSSCTRIIATSVSWSSKVSGATNCEESLTLVPGCEYPSMIRGAVIAGRACCSAIVCNPTPAIWNWMSFGVDALGLGWLFEKSIAKRSVPNAGELAESAVDVTRNGLIALMGGVENSEESPTFKPDPAGVDSKVAVAVTQSPVGAT